MDNKKTNISREDISKAINDEFGFSKKECQLIVSDIIEIIISPINNMVKVKQHVVLLGYILRAEEVYNFGDGYIC